MIVSINQPSYLPWLGYFDRIAKSDLHIILDHVQFEKNSVTNRNKVRTKTGWSWLSVPVLSKGRFGKLAIDQIEVDHTSRWAKKHLMTLQANYSRSAYYQHYSSYFEHFYRQDWFYLAQMLQESTRYLLKELGIQTQQLNSSEIGLQSKKADLILELCIKVGATTYLSGPFGREYLDEGAFEKAGIELKYHDYVHPSYDQCFDGFEPYMSVVDLLFNHGEKSLEILTS
jgi:hypothetical protein